MTFIAVVCTLFIAAVGALGVVSPSRLLAFVRRVQTPAGLYFAAGFRIVMGVAMFSAAATSRAPGLLQIFGVFVVLAGLATPFFGLPRYRALLDWWSARGTTFVRAWAAVAVVFGSLLAYALLP